MMRCQLTKPAVNIRSIRYDTFAQRPADGALKTMEDCPAMPTDTPMQLGMIGLGRMGANLVRRLMRDGHRCVAYDRNPDVVKALEAEGATGAESLADFAGKLD